MLSNVYRIERLKTQLALLEQEATSRRKRKEGDGDAALDEAKLNKLYALVEVCSTVHCFATNIAQKDAQTVFFLQ